MISTFSALYCPKINNVNDSYIWVNLRTSCILPIFCILKKETFIMSYYLTHTSIWVLLFGWTSSSVAIPLLYLVVGRLFLNRGSGFGVKHSSGSGILSVGSSYRRALSTLMSPWIWATVTFLFCILSRNTFWQNRFAASELFYVTVVSTKKADLNDFAYGRKYAFSTGWAQSRNMLSFWKDFRFQLKMKEHKIPLSLCCVIMELP